MADRPPHSVPVVELAGASLRFGQRVLWEDLSLQIGAEEFVAVLGPNGAGKTSLIRVLLGLQPLSAGTVRVAGRRPRRGDQRIGYIPQQRGFDRDLTLRGRDFVRLGLDGHRWGLTLPSRAARHAVERALAAVGAQAYAGAPLGTLSGGEQQRLRIAQALLGEPKLLLCDEPLLSLDLRQQQTIAALIDQRRRALHIPVLLITHEINPVLPYLDRVLYLVGGRWAVGTPDEIMTSQQLSALYQAPVDVVRIRDRIVVVGATEAAEAHHASEPAAPGRRR